MIMWILKIVAVIIVIVVIAVNIGNVLFDKKVEKEVREMFAESKIGI